MDNCVNSGFVKFDFKNVDGTFLCANDSLTNVNNVIDKLDQSLQTQSDIDGVKDNVYEHIPYKTLKTGCASKRRRPDALTEYMNNLWTGFFTN